MIMDKNDFNPSLLSPINLAFVGDAVYDLLYRRMIVESANRPAKDLNKEKVRGVNAVSQAEACRKIMPFLTEEEQTIIRRGRNTRTNHIPKNADSASYHYATALEALFGYLYLSGKNDRITELFNIITKEL